jgi:seryl-tRNA synthetase
VLDIRKIREGAPGMKEALSKRGDTEISNTLDNILDLDIKRRQALVEVNTLKAKRNTTSKEIGAMVRDGLVADDKILEMRKLGEKVTTLDSGVRELDSQIYNLMLTVPNIPHEEVPSGGIENNEIIRTVGSPKQFDFDPKPHWELGEKLKILDFPRGSKISGSGFPVLKGKGALLQRCLIDFMLDLHTQNHGYIELRIPYLVTRESLVGTGQLPKFAEESYQTVRDDLWLIPTAEVPVTNLHRGELLAFEELPVQYTAYSPCFRREAGAAGAENRGLLRVHQFDKVELVRYVTPENSRQALEEITKEAESILHALGLTYRVLKLAGGDLGFSAEMTYDIEVWSPGVKQWLEVSSCSCFSDFQARRTDLRFRPGENDKPRFVHTLNGSALALPRLLVSLIETYQTAGGEIEVPEAIQDRLGLSVISA